MDFKEIDFSEEKMALNYHWFLNRNGNDTDHLKEMEIIENSFIKSHSLLIEALDSGTHRHKHHMAHLNMKLLKLLKYKYSAVFYYEECLKKVYAENIKGLIDLLKPIFEVITFGDSINSVQYFSHSEQKMLIAPFLFDLKERGYLDREMRLKALRNKLGRKLDEIYQNLPIETKKMIDSKITE